MERIISWVEIPAVNLERAVSFYNSILDLDLKVSDFGEEKMAFFSTGEGAISFAPGFKPSKDGILVSFNTGEDLNGTIERIEKQGGSILQPKTKIEAEGLGYFAIFVDSEGNKAGLYGDK